MPSGVEKRRSKRKQVSVPLKYKDFEPIRKRLRLRNRKEGSSASVRVSNIICESPARSTRQDTIESLQDSETEDCENLVRKTRKKQGQQEQASNDFDLMLVGDQEPLACHMPWYQREQSFVSIKEPDPLALEIPQRSDGRDGVELFQSCFKEELADSNKLYLGGTGTEPNLALQVVHAENTEAPMQIICYERSNKKSKEKGKDPMKPPTNPREGTVSSDEANGVLCFTEQRAEISKEFSPCGNVLELSKNASIKLHINEPIVGKMLMDEIIPSINSPAPPLLLSGDSSLKGNSHRNEDDGLNPLKSRSLYDDDQGGDSSNLSRLDVASSPTGEAKIYITCNSSRKPGFRMPSLSKVVGLLEQKYKKVYGVEDDSFSVMEVMKEVCQRFLDIAASPAESCRSKNESPIFCSSGKLDSEIIRGEENCEGSISQPSNHSSKAFASQNLMKASAQIRQGVIQVDLESRDSEIISLQSKKRETVKAWSILKPCGGNALVIHSSSPNSSYIHDITGGKEKVKISLINGSTSFFYISGNMVYDKANLKLTLSSIPDEDCCSSCSKDCLSFTMPCKCAQKTGGEFVYVPGGLLKESFLDECIASNQVTEGRLMRKFIKECWTKCGCGNNCGNRVVQKGISVELQVFQSFAGKGLGVRTLEDLPKGAFVCEYAGEVVTCSEFEERNSRRSSHEVNEYSVLLDAGWGEEGILKDDEALYLDATHCGNVARFLNHRCSDANLIGIPVKVEIPSHHYYHLAFFTTRKVAAMEELTWDYGVSFGGPEKPFNCLCGSSLCRDIN